MRCVAFAYQLECVRPAHGLNGLRFARAKVNEVFADHKSLETPILMPRCWLQANAATKVRTVRCCSPSCTWP